MILEYDDEIESHLNSELTPTEWRRAAVSLTATIALDPIEGLTSCRDLIECEILEKDKGLAGTMVFGLSRAADTEPEAAESVLDEIVQVGGLDVAEALVELRREHAMNEFGASASRYTQGWLKKIISKGRERDDGRVALMLAVLDRHTPVDLVSRDVYVNVTGGVRIAEPAADLALAQALASSRLDLALPGASPESGVRLAPGPGRFLTEAEMRQRERENLVAALEYAGWKIYGAGGAADLLGIKPTTLASRIRALGIERPPRALRLAR